MFATDIHFPTLVYYLQARLEPTRVEYLAELHANSRPVLPEYIKRGWNQITLANTLGYYDTATIVAAKTITMQGLYSQHFIFTVTYEQAQ